MMVPGLLLLAITALAILLYCDNVRCFFQRARPFSCVWAVAWRIDTRYSIELYSSRGEYETLLAAN